jgi:hypothetical protein
MTLLHELRIWLGFALAYAGSRLLGFRIISTYVPSDADGLIRAMHFAEDQTQLNSSMRSYVEELDASYSYEL